MITCPFCNTQVKDTTDQKLVEDDHANNFYCPNYVEIRQSNALNLGKRLCHFSRNQLSYLVNGSPIYSYQAIMLPFQITWKTGGIITVYKLNQEGDRETSIPTYQSKRGALYNDFIKACHRFKNLVVFS